MTAPASASTPRTAAFEAGDILRIMITNIEDWDGATDHRNGVIHIDPEAALDPDRTAAVFADAWRTLTEHRQPKLTAVEGGGRQTKRRGNLRLVTA